MAFPNLDKCSCGSPRAPKVSLGSHGLTGAHSKFSLGGKRTGSLKSKTTESDLFVVETNRKNSAITNQQQQHQHQQQQRFEGLPPANQNEYTKTSLDRPSPQERIKRRQLVQQTNPCQDQSHVTTTTTTTKAGTKTDSPLIENLDPADDVFVNYYKQVRSANKTFSTFLGPPVHPQKYLKDDRCLLLQGVREAGSNRNFTNRSDHVTPGDDSDDQQDKNASEYTPLSFDTNYVKVSPPKLTRRQKKSGGSDSDASKEPAQGGHKKIKKDKAQSPKESGRKSVSRDEPPNSSGSDRDGSSSARNSDVFAEEEEEEEEEKDEDPEADVAHLPLPPPLLDFDRGNLSSNDSEDFPPPPPPPPPSAWDETTSDYISLENAEKRALLSQSSDESPPSTSRYQPSKAIVKAKAVSDPIQSQESATPVQINEGKKEEEEETEEVEEVDGEAKDDGNSILEFKLTVRLGGTNRMAGKDGDVQQDRLSAEVRRKSLSSKEATESVVGEDEMDLKSAIVAEICHVVSQSLTKDKLGRGQTAVGPKLQTTETVGNSNRMTKSFQNSAYGIPNEILFNSSFEKFKKSNTPLVAHRNVAQVQPNVSSPPEGKVECPHDVVDEGPSLEDFETIKSLQKAKRKTLADFVSSKVTTVAQVHHSADDILAGEKQIKNDSIFSLDLLKRASAAAGQDEPLDLAAPKPGQDRYEVGNCHATEMGQPMTSKQTHMNWDDLMEEAKSLGIPLSRPYHGVAPAASTTTEKQKQKSPLKSAAEAASAGQDKHRPASSDSAVGTSISSVSSTAVQSKNTVPKLISHKAALQQVSTPGCCYYRDKGRRALSDFYECECRCRSDLQSKSSSVLGNSTTKAEKKFSFFKDRLKLSNFFCKRFCSKSVERPVVDRQSCQSCQCCCPGKGRGRSQQQQQQQLQQQQQQLLATKSSRDRSSTRNGTQRVSNQRGQSLQEKDIELEAGEENGFSISGRCSNSIDRCFPSMEAKMAGSNPTSRRRKRQSDDKNMEGTSCSPTSDWSPNDLFKNLEEIKKHGWYWGAIGFEEAESLLADRKDGSFLVRDSSDDRYILSLSFRSQGCTHHTRIEQHKGRFSFFSHSSSHEASSVDEFIANAMRLSSEGKNLYYLRPKSSNSLPIPVQLLFPVLRPTSPGKQ